jgi:SNF2 family DNA or RNA helicase
MQIKISIHNKEFVLIKCDQPSHEIEIFLDQEFNKNIKDGEVLIDLPSFMRNLDNINKFLHMQSIAPQISEELKSAVNNLPNYTKASTAADISADTILSNIKKEGFTRTPTEDQLRNLMSLCSKKAAASFSVPGAGKTTEALAFYAFHKRHEKSKLLVISPINAFMSWDDEIIQCFDNKNRISRLRGSIKEIELKILENPQHMIINYDSLRSIEKFSLIRNLILDNPDIVVVLDESHKSKGESISEILGQLASYINYKLILTGTPMPQAPSDLRAQFNFLYPQEHVPFDEKLIELFEPIYVRTTKEDLDLFPVDYKIVSVPPNPAFNIFYEEYFIKRLQEGSTLQDILSVKSFKKAVLKFIKLLSNPASCIEELFELDPGLAIQIENEGDGAKIDALIERAECLIAKGEKVLIWTSFVVNVELIASKFGNKAVFIHGSVATDKGGYEDSQMEDMDTREARIRRFKEDPNCMVLVANPAAAAESISLHEQCNYALYLDRTYNAGQFLQSQDRIHRLISKEKEKQKFIEVFILDLPWCADWKVHEALNRKIDAMSAFLNDPSLVSLEGFNFDTDTFSDENPMDSIDEEEFMNP